MPLHEIIIICEAARVQKLISDTCSSVQFQYESKEIQGGGGVRGEVGKRRR